jgi:hypothetical protein
MLHRQTDLPTPVLEQFEGSLHERRSAKLLGVELSDQVLTKIGYFID